MNHTTATTTANTDKSLANAVRKARKVKCHVKPLANRRYLVTTPDKHRYVVRMEIHDGLRWALCNCACGSRGFACYHVPFAALVDSALHGYPLTRLLQLQEAA